MTMMTFNRHRLVALRIAAGFTSQVALAAALGVTRQAVNHWETGTRAPTAEWLLALTQVLGCQLADLFGSDPVLAE